MADETSQDHGATRRAVLLGVGLAGAGGVLTGCSTAAVPYEANEAGQPPGPALAAAPAQASVPPSDAPMPAGAGAGAGPGAGAGDPGGGTATGMAQGTLLAKVTEIPVGGGVVFMNQQVVVTQPVKGVFKAFSAVCTHVGCVCNRVANGTINCPCHGAEFKISDGAVVAGPAPAPLPARTITVSNGKIVLQ